ncbi:MAG: TlpA disulfide reductase family protein [Candidatus Thiodiazotropha endolucinida]|uniref:AhpC/TSA family protein n=1 Tax=Candidatus Thiodiazotropha endolucinida TaxID=1655433 RepID=A0A7Z0VIQ3_9GAMM|nr:TlpA disulfide reductase family protein [Candidatus Thiodiazotropha endolucinida]ODJ86362.1 AhpC/TSA family protein [Candidatus Thiodiazotropha endolucinida]
MRNLTFVSFLFTILLMTPPLTAGTYPMAPALDVDEWINGDGVTLDDLKGKVVVIDFFQMWCPGCNDFSIPLVAYWEQRFAEEIAAGQLVMLSIHTVFEGHDYQRTERLIPYLKKKGINHLVGVDRHQGNDPTPQTMKLFRTRGTPEMAILDKQGRIRFQRFGGFDAETATTLIHDLLQESVD